MKHRSSEKLFSCILTLALGFSISGFSFGCSEQATSSNSIPKPPDESLRVAFRYPDDPVLLDKQACDQCFSQLAEQTTLLVLQAPDHRLSPEDLQIITSIQQRYYRYGVFVLLVDLNGTANWPELRKTLEEAQANFPAVYLLGNTGKNVFLPTASVDKNQLWIFRGQPAQKIIIRPPFDRRILDNRMNQLLSH
jgi:hypothetical protein